MYFKRLEDLRKEEDKTQEEVAIYLGIQREVYRRYEKGTRLIPVVHLVKLASLYGVSVDYIVGLTDVKNVYR